MTLVYNFKSVVVVADVSYVSFIGIVLYKSCLGIDNAINVNQLVESFALHRLLYIFMKIDGLFI